MSASVKCPEHNRSWRYSYDTLKCRCTVCTAQNALKSERQRRRRGDRVQRRKTPGALLCPIIGKPPVTAYREGCRCAVCRPTANKTYVGRRTVGELEALWARADAAFRSDDGYLLNMCDEIVKIVAKREKA